MLNHNKILFDSIRFLSNDIYDNDCNKFDLFKESDQYGINWIKVKNWIDWIFIVKFSVFNNKFVKCSWFFNGYFSEIILFLTIFGA